MTNMAILSVGLTLVFGLLSVVFFFRARRHKRLTFTYDQSELHTKTHPEIKITFRERPIENLSRLRVVCWSSGTQEIRGDDIPMNGPPAVVFSNAVVLSVAHIRSTDDTAFIAEQYDSHSISIRFGFLNPGDCGLFEVLYEASESKTPRVQFLTRVIGGRPTDVRLFTGPLTPVESVAAFILPLTCLLATYLSAAFVRRSVTLLPDGFSITLTAAGLVLILLGGAAGSLVAVRRYVRRLHESRLPKLAKEFFTGRPYSALHRAAQETGSLTTPSA